MSRPSSAGISCGCSGEGRKDPSSSLCMTLYCVILVLHAIGVLVGRGAPGFQQLCGVFRLLVFRF